MFLVFWYCLILKAIAYSVPSQCLSLSLSVRLAVSHILPVSVSLFVWLVAWVFPKVLFIFTVNFLFSLISDWLPTNLKRIYIITLYLYWWVEVSDLYLFCFVLSGKIDAQIQIHILDIFRSRRFAPFLKAGC